MRLSQRCIAVATLVLLIGCHRSVGLDRPAAETAPESWPVGNLHQEQDAQLTSVVVGAVIAAGAPQSGGQPLPSTVVSIAALDREVRTDESGRFRLDSVPAGRHLLVARRIGYQPLRDSISVAPDSGVRVRIVLASSPTEPSCDLVIVARQDRRWWWPWR